MYAARMKELYPKVKKTLKERFLDKVTYEPNTGCWLWLGACQSGGYGFMAIDATRKNRKSSAAHRISYILFKGDIPNEIVVCHTCDVCSCVNPDHLFLGTNADNSKDMVLKGRQAKGESQGASKLKSDYVLKIMDMCNNGVSKIEISRIFNVTKENIYSICSGETWGHLTLLKAKPPRQPS